MFKRLANKRKLTEQKKGSSLITHLKPNSVITEDFRTIRTNIEFSSIDEKIKTLLVTSSLPFEGKSTISSNLANVFSKNGKKILYVDADLRKPMLHRTFSIPNEKGLSTILASKFNSIRWNDIVVNGPEDNLYLLPTGPIPPNPAELLDSEQMTKLMDELKNHFDLIIYDTPPVIPVTDSQILADKVDGVVLVARYNYTKKQTIKLTKDKLDAVEAKIIGYIFNAVPDDNQDDYGYTEYYEE